MRGHIRKRAKDSWTVVVELPRDPETGKRRQKWVAVKGTKRDAERVLAELAAKAQSGVLGTAPTRLSLGDYLDKWYAVAQSGVSLHTRRNWRYALACWRAALGSVPLVRLTPMDIQIALEHLPGHLSGSSKNMYFRVLKAALRQAVRWGMLANNPAEGVRPPLAKAREIRVWDEGQARRFLEAARGSRYYALFYTALATGMRLGELLGLAWEDVDLGQGVVHVRRSLATCVTRTGEPAWQEPKTLSSRRRIPLGKEAVEVLKQHRKTQLEERLRLGSLWRDYGLVFCTRTGGPLFEPNVWKALERCSLKAGVPRIRFHDLRHTHATLLLRQGVHAKVVSERLGHASVKITLDTYSHVLPDTQGEAARAIERALGGDGLRVSKALAKQPPCGGGDG